MTRDWWLAAFVGVGLVICLTLMLVGLITAMNP